MQPPRTGQPAFKRRLKKSNPAMAQRGSGMGKPEIAGKAFGADPRPCGEQPLKVERAEMRRGGDIGQLRPIAKMCGDIVDAARNAAIINVLLAMHNSLLTVSYLPAS
jgi:hypothetical protein|tara:strand:- start:1085 stop:1405 length:321 start_codon:yes stop_codon:yes gene_type:complete